MRLLKIHQRRRVEEINLGVSGPYNPIHSLRFQV